VRPLVGVFVGGRARRMGGVAKGLLVAPGSEETLVARLVRVGQEALGDPDCVLVGSKTSYAGLGLGMIEDEPAGTGPLGGLCALLQAAVERGNGPVIALACDLPYVTATMIARLASHAPDADAVAPRPNDIWQPLVARYAPEPALAATRAALGSGERALYRVLERLGTRAVELPLMPSEIALLRDWDEPEDVP
jgi:molybdenum cofactor guanylyltransferase